MANLPNAAPLLNQGPAQGSHAQHAPNQPKRQHRHRKHHSIQQQADGSVSDSVAMPSATAHSARAPKQRHQSVAVPPAPEQNGHLADMNTSKPRPVSLGGTMIPATPGKEQAYAGSAFQASPAPSSLPVPKFFSKSVPNVANQSLAARMAASETNTENEDSSPEPEVVSPAHPPPSRGSQQSPLDFFFQADREEKEKSRSSSLMLSPEMAVRQPVPATEPRQVQNSSRNVFLSELDGDSALPTPKTLPHPARAHPTSSPHTYTPESVSANEAASQSLKNLLFNQINSPPPPAPTPPQTRPRSNPRTPDLPFDNTPSPFQQRSSSGPSTPMTEQQQHQFYYGDRRNLSPLFKAAQRSDTPSRPSGLRQGELASDIGAGVGGEERMVDAKAFSREFIDQTVRNSPSAVLPQLPGIHHPPPPSAIPLGPFQQYQWEQPQLQHPSHRVDYQQEDPPRAAMFHDRGKTAQANGGAEPRTQPQQHRQQQQQQPRDQDLRGMEDDLRRMLNLNALS